MPDVMQKRLLVTWVVERVLVIFGNCLGFLNGLECIMLSSHLK